MLVIKERKLKSGGTWNHNFCYFIMQVPIFHKVLSVPWNKSKIEMSLEFVHNIPRHNEGSTRAENQLFDVTLLEYFSTLMFELDDTVT